MAVFLSPGVYTREVDLGVLPTAVGQLRPAFFGTAKRGPMNTPVLLTSSAQAIDIFGEPFPESYGMYSLLGYFEEGNQAYFTRVGVESEPGQPDDLASIAIDTSGARVQGWGRIPLFAGIDFGRINLREPTAANPFRFGAAVIENADYNDADVSSTDGATTATVTVTGEYDGDGPESFTLLVTGEPDETGDSAAVGATYQVIKNSDGTVVAEGAFETGTGGGGQIEPIVLDNGLTLDVAVSAGKLGTNDTFTFNARPDNRTFFFAIEGTYDNDYVMPDATYDNVQDFVDAFNDLLSGEDYVAVAHTLDDGTVIPQIRTTVAGRWIQLAGSAAWALEVGQAQYAYDIPRSYLVGTQDEPYNIQSRNNQVTLNVIGTQTSRQIRFTVPSGVNLSTAQLAANIQPAGVVPGGRVFDAYALNVPGGAQRLFLIVTTDNEFDQLQLVATFSYLKTLRFAETVGVLFPYKRGYRGFSDTRVALPDGSADDESVPLSCQLDPDSDQCAADSSYYENIVGWLVATSPGTWIDDYTVTVDTYTEGIGDVAGRYKITIRDKHGVPVDVVPDVSFDQTQDRYIADVINPGTKYGGANGNAYVNWEPRGAFLANDPATTDYVARQPSTFANRPFQGAANGIPLDPAYSSELDAAIIGNPATGSGIFSVQNPETFDINLLVTPGFSSGAVIGQCLQMCEARGDILYLVDPPFGLRPQQVVDWHNGMLLSDLRNAINSSYGALYWSWIRVFDQFNNIEVWVPPSGHISAIFSRTSRIAEQWSSPAGLSRGRLLTALDVEYNPAMGERDLLYGSGNAVNPIVNFPQDGITVWGQRTLQRTQSALDQVPVRMLLIYLKKNLTRLLRAFLFEPNDSVLWAQVTNTLEPFLADVQARRGLTGFKVVCNETNNTPERIDRGELWVSIFVKPTRSVQFAVLNINVLRTAASFSVAETLAAGGLIGR